MVDKAKLLPIIALGSSSRALVNKSKIDKEKKLLTEQIQNEMVRRDLIAKQEISNELKALENLQKSEPKNSEPHYCLG